MAAPSQQITGLMSGMDTQSIVTQLMEIEKQPYTKLDTKKQTEQLRLKAYQAVNSMLLKFRTSVSTLSSQKLWTSKSAASSNESSLTATASQYAVNGNYTFRVAQMATATQYMSKGFSDTKATFGKADANGSYSALGSINLASAKTRVDNSAKLESLNGGKGVYRGSVRITDSRGNSSIVDLSGAETINDVVATINNAGGIQVRASIGRNDAGESFLQIADQAAGGGTLKIQNVGQGTTAKDLGLTVDADSSGTVVGKNLYYMGNDTYLSELRDGLGVEEGKLNIYVEKGGASASVSVDLADIKTVGELANAVNNALAGNSAAFGGMKFGLNEARNGFQFTGAQDGATYIVYNDWELQGNAQGNPQLAEQLGLSGSFIADATGVVKGSRVYGDVDSPLLASLTGAAGTGIGSAGANGQSRVTAGALTENTKASYLNDGKGVNIGAGLIVKFYENNGDGSRTFNNIVDPVELNTLLQDENATVGDVLDKLNAGLASYADAQGVKGLEGMSFAVENGSIVVKGASAAHGYEITGDLALSLGLDRTKAQMSGRDGLSGALRDELDDLYATTDIRLGNQNLLDTTKLVDMKGTTGAQDTSGADIAIKDIPKSLADFLGGAGDFKVAIGGQEYDLQAAVDKLVADKGDDATIGDLFTGINDALKKAVTDAGGSASDAPYLYYDNLSTGFQWRNVDIGETFEVTGDFAGLFGLEKSYDPAGEATNVAIADSAGKDLNPTMPGYLTPIEINAGSIGTITLDQLNYGKGLSLSGDMADTLDLTFTDKDDPTQKVVISVSKQEIVDALNDIGVANPQDASIQAYVGTLNNLIGEKIEDAKTAGTLGADAAFTIGTNQYGLNIQTARGDQAGDAVQLGGDLVMNGSWGLGNVAVVGQADPAYDHAAQLSYLNPAVPTEQEVSGLGSVTLSVGGGEIALSTDGLGKDSTLRDLMDKLNEELANNGLSDVSFVLNSSGTGLAVDNGSNKDVTVVNKQDANTLARDLGLLADGFQDRTVEANSFADGSSLGRKVVDRSTALSSLAGAKTLDLGQLNLTNTTGAASRIDISACETVGDLVDAINNLNVNFGLRASINAAGDGISIEEYWTPGNEPDSSRRTGDIRVEDEGSGNIASILGIATTGTGYVSKDVGYAQQKSRIVGSVNKTLTVTGSDTLESVMNRLSEIGYKTAIINDGSGANPYRLTISAANTGSASDFVIATGLDFLGLTQTSRGKDAKVLYGNPDSGVSPIMLSSSTNSNSTAILGLTLDIKGTSDTYTTLTVDTDKSKVVDEIKNLAQTYNDLNDLVSYLDGYDPETNEKGVLFGDQNLRSLMKSIDDMFYEVYNPEGWSYGEKSEKSAWTWMDFGVSFGTNQTNAASGKEGSGWYSTMELDTEALESMVASNWDTLYQSLASQTNVSNSKAKGKAAASASFNFQYDVDPATGLQVVPAGQSSVNNAINNDSTTTLANGNGFTANKTIAEGENQYTVFFQGTTTLSRLSIYHAGSDTYIPGAGAGNAALKDFKIEYLDAATGKWETMRDIKNNTSNANHLGFVVPTAVQAVRITANSTNAADGKFRLLDVQAYEDTGLAGRMNRVTTMLGDVSTGFMAERTTAIEQSIAEIDEQMTRIQERIDAKEASLWRQFTAMETALGKLKSQGNQLSSMLGSSSKS